MIKRLEISVLAALLFSAVLSVCAMNVESAQIRESVFRLHILANSDSEADQALKLKVRDRLLEVSGDLFTHAGSRDEAVAAAEAQLPLLEREAERVLRENGCADGVTAAVEEAYFTTRTYGDVTLPAGRYTALRVVIGEGKGHNWWCVMFPPLCISAVSEDEARLDDVLNEQQLDFVEGSPYEPRFKCVELYEQFKETIERGREDDSDRSGNGGQR